MLAAGLPSPSEKAQREAKLLCLSEALAQLPEDEFTAVTLRYLHECSVSAVGQRLGRTRAGAAGVLRRALERLRKLMEDEP